MPKTSIRPARLPGQPAAKRPTLPPGNPPPRAPKKTTLEDIKAASHGLRGALPEHLGDEADHFDEAGKQLLKFHGVYQQDNRDQRGREKTYSFMVRSKLPGGRLTAAQYLAHDALADQFGDGTLRITTRQDFQLHGVLKGDLHASINVLNETLVTTLGACGDVVRNVMCCPVPTDGDPIREEIEALSQRLSDHLLPPTTAYHEIWVDGEKVHDGEAEAARAALYGETFLPRKFKIAVAPPGDNCVDVYTQDVGLIALAEDGRLRGFNLLVGGGLGMTHKKLNTFPRLADPFAFLLPSEVVPVVEQIVRLQRDSGDRTDRRQARLKYLIHRWGLDRFRTELERRLGYVLEPPAPSPPLDLDLHLGWLPQADGRWFLGLSVENGRLRDSGVQQLRTGLRTVIKRFQPGVRLTPNHDVLLTNLHEADRSAIDAMLATHSIRPHTDLTNARKLSMACPALPTCGLALAESERVLPHIIDQIEADLAALGLADEKLTIRMTGCPNGCARPYVADLAFVGRSLDRYTVFVGGRADGTRLNTVFCDLVPLAELADAVRPLFVRFKLDRLPGESFGDFCHRVGLDALHAFAHVASENGHAR